MRKEKSWARIATWLVVGTLTGWLAGCGPNEAGPLKFPLERTETRLARGKYLVLAVTVCFHCHSDIDWGAAEAPPKPGTIGGGVLFPLEGLPGKIVCANISPDKETGAGLWTDEDFYKAMTQGIGKDGRTLFPMMPYKRFREMSDEDLASVIVYVRSIEPVRNALPQTELLEAVKQSLKPLPPKPFAPPPDLSHPVKRGAYLVNAADCVTCHTPPKPNGEPQPGMEFAGGWVLKGPWGEPASSNITPDPSGIPYYDEAMFIKTIRTGRVQARKLNILMPWPSFRNMTDQDLKAVFAYLRILKPVAHRVDNTEAATPCKRCGFTHGLGGMN